MKTTKWIKFALYLSYLVILVAGVSLGYLYYYTQGEKCEANPFIYGIKDVNRLNQENFTCECRSDENFNKGFRFNEAGITLGGNPL